MNNIKKVIIIMSVVLVSMVVIGLIIFYFYQINPSTKVKSCLKQEIKQIQTTISKINSGTYNSLLASQNASKNRKTNIKPLSTTTNLNFDLDIISDIEKEKNNKISVLESLLNNSDISITTNIDSQNKYIENKIEYKYDKEKLNSNLYFDNNNVYFKANDLLDKYIVLNDENNKLLNYLLRFLNSGINLREVNYILSIVSNAIGNTKISDKLSSGSEVLKISSNVVDTSKDVLTIDNELMVRFCKNLLKSISKDKTALEILQKIEGSENITDLQNKVIRAYNALDNGIVKILDDEQTITLSTYMSGIFPKFIMQSLDYNINSDFVGNISLLNMNIDGFSQHIIFTQGECKATLNMNSLSDSKYNMQLIINENEVTQYIANLSGLISPKKIDANYTITKENQQIITGNLKYSQSFESSKKDANLEFEFEFDAQNIDYGKGSIKLDFQTKQINSVKKQNFEETVKYNELNLNDSILFKTKLNKKLPTLYKLFQ